VRTRALGTAVPSRASPGDHGHRPAVLRRDERRGKLVFSRTLRSAEGVNTTIAAGDATEEIDKLRRGGDGHLVVWGQP